MNSSGKYKFYNDRKHIKIIFNMEKRAIILTLKFLRGCDVLVTFEIISHNKDAKIYEDKT